VIKSSPFIEPGFHYRVFKSPPVDAVHSGALRTVSLLYTSAFCGTFVYRWRLYCALYCIHYTDQRC